MELPEDSVLYPEPVPFSDKQYHRQYGLNALPREETGELMYQGSSKEEYDGYVAWLADYLYTAFSIGDERTPDFETAKCRAGAFGGWAAMTDWTIVRAEGYFRHIDQEPWDENGQWFLDQVDLSALRSEGVSDDEDEDCVEDEDGYFIYLPTREEVIQIAWETGQRARYGLTDADEQTYCDLAYRIYLAHILKHFPDKAQRIQLLNAYFADFQETDSK